MKNYVFAFSAVIILLLGAAMIPKINVDPKEKEEVIMNTIKEFLKAQHYSPKELNDEFSNTTYELFIDYLDNSKRFFTQKEIDQLGAYRTQLDDQLMNGSLEFLELADQLSESSIARSKEIFDKVIKEDFDFNQKDFIEIDSDKKEFPKDLEELENNWRKTIKYDILSRLDSKLEDQKKELEKDPTIETKDVATLQKEVQEKTKENFDRWFERLDQLRRSDRFEFYINSIMHTFDPHSDYYTPKDKQDFDLRFSGKLEGIGAQLSPEGSFTKVNSIVPGGPAWKGKQLSAEDIITHVAQEGEEPIDIEGMRLDDVVSQIRGPKGTKVTLTVKKKDGTTEDIEITRDVIVMEEGNAKSAILELDEVSKKVGFIHLPSFYVDFSDKNGRSCYRDMKKEIAKLKAENVDGIVLDLRFNGGGSLQDVVKIGGLFIEKGPIVQVKTKERRPYVLKDTDSTVQYDGPFVILVNESSASASEIMAAAMQDYDRAIIIGSPSTFGKGTVQRFFDLDREVNLISDYKPLGEVKVTVQKFFRVNGGSTQLKGVEPDVVLPDAYQFIKTGEKDYKNALVYDEIDPVAYNQEVFVIKDKKQIIEKSQQRISNDPNFSLVLENAKLLSDKKDDSKYPLDLESFRSKIMERESLSEKFDEIGNIEIEGLRVSNLESDMEYIQADSSRIGRNEAFIEGLAKDIYAKESIMIINDLIDQN